MDPAEAGQGSRGTVGRKSLAEPRRQQMLAAIAECIGKRGLAASTLEVMAQESGFSRPHIRHYLGNRDQVIEAVWDYVMNPYQQRLASAAAEATPGTLDDLLDYLFGPEMERQPEDLAIDAMINGAQTHPTLGAKVQRTYEELIGHIYRVLQVSAPALPRAEVEDAAFSLLSLALGATFFTSMSFPESRRRGIRRVAYVLVQTLLAASNERSLDHETRLNH